MSSYPKILRFMSSFTVKSCHAALKFEILNPKYETISKFKCSKFETAQRCCSGQRPLSLEHWDFGHWKFTSDFDIRISDSLTGGDRRDGRFSVE